MKTIDLFAGAGGLSEGLRSSGFECLWANEFDRYARATFEKNFPSAEVNGQDIRTLDAKDIRNSLNLEAGELDVVVGGPPCQGFSTYGKRDSEDPRNQLYINFLSFVQEFRPKYFVLENVTGLLSMDGGTVIKDIVERATLLGYSCVIHNIRAELYGVPQKRRRIFVIGNLTNYTVEFISPFCEEKSLAPNKNFSLFESTENSGFLTVGDAISDLLDTPVYLPSETQKYADYGSIPQTPYQELMRGDLSRVSHHSAKRMLGIRRLRLALLQPGDYGVTLRSRIETDGLPLEVIDEILRSEGLRDHKGCRSQDIDKEMQLKKMLHEGHHSIEEIFDFLDSGGFANKYRRLSWNDPSHTLVAHMARDCSDFVHPVLDRFLSVREAARLQSFPDRFEFPGSQFQQLKQIGNAVPPLLGKAVGLSIMSHDISINQ